jgi:hypothetical protein
MTTTLTEGITYRVTYRPTLYGKPITKVLTLTTILTGYTGTVTYIMHGPRGGKVVLGATEIVRTEVTK